MNRAARRRQRAQLRRAKDRKPPPIGARGSEPWRVRFTKEPAVHPVRK